MKGEKPKQQLDSIVPTLQEDLDLPNLKEMGWEINNSKMNKIITNNNSINIILITLTLIHKNYKRS